jgi:hypothetical protein
MGCLSQQLKYCPFRNAKRQIASRCVDLPRLPQLAHEFLNPKLTVKLEPNRVLERLNNLSCEPNLSRAAPLSGARFSRRVFMSATAQLTKLAELRAKTDQQLVSLIYNALEVGLLLAANEPDVDPEGVLHRRAADIYAGVVMLVEKVEDGRERGRLEEKLKQLRDTLEQRRGATPRAIGDRSCAGVIDVAGKCATPARMRATLQGKEAPIPPPRESGPARVLATETMRQQPERAGHQ